MNNEKLMCAFGAYINRFALRNTLIANYFLLRCIYINVILSVSEES